MAEESQTPEDNQPSSKPRSKKRVVLTAIAVVVGVLAVGLGLGAYKLSQQPKATVSTNCTQSDAAAVTVVYDGSTFSPKCVSVNAGTNVTWDNQSTSTLMVGVDPHPIHSGDKALTGGEFVLTVNAGTSKSEVISKVGTYGYHNHLNASATGVLEVR